MITVLGRGTIEIVPDIVTISVGVTTKQATAAAAMDATSTAAKKVIELAKARGVEDRDIRTQAVTLAPAMRNRRDPQGGITQEPDGYTASNIVQVTLRKIETLGDLSRDIVDKGANTIAGIEFGASNIDALRDTARAQAVADAMRQAKIIADAAGAKLGPIMHIESPPRRAAQPMESGYSMRKAAPMRASAPIEAGVIEVTAEVDIAWRLAD